MTRYFVTAWCDRPFYAQCEVEAETPQEALAKARNAIDDEPAEECNEAYCWDRWRMDTADAEGGLHFDEDAALREAAPTLLRACRMVVDRWERGDLSEAARACQDAITEALGIQPVEPPKPLATGVPGGRNDVPNSSLRKQDAKRTDAEARDEADRNDDMSCYPECQKGGPLEHFRGRSHLPPDPEAMNDRRAAWAGAALALFGHLTGADEEDALGDLLADLMHGCDRHDFDFDAALDRARWHYQAETQANETSPTERTTP